MTARQKTYKKAINISRNNIPHRLKGYCRSTRTGLSYSPSSKERAKLFVAVSHICTRGFLKVDNKMR